MRNFNVFLAVIAVLAASCSRELTDETGIPSGQKILKSSPVGDVVGKMVVGYQGWFSCSGDGSPRNVWSHWAATGTIPAPGNQTFELWPDMREYARGFQTGYANLGNGSPAQLFASYDDNVVDKHFQWMQTYGIDCAAVQRFGSVLGDATMKAQRDGIATKVRNAAQTYGRKFYVMYDISSWTNFQSEIKTDWTNVIKGSLDLLASGSYAKQNGLPVVCIWGIGLANRPGDVTSWTEVINWFKGQGCYVIAGTPREWRTDATNLPAYTAANMVSPWTVGGFSGTGGADSYASSTMQPDRDYCNANGLDYQPVAFVGFAWSNWNGGTRNSIPRIHGDFMWRQFYNIRNQGIPNVYVAMFDEYDEATAIAKAAENSSMIPTDQYFLTLDADGTAVSSDFYLRLANDGAKMIKGQTGLVSEHPTSHDGSPGGAIYMDNCDASTGWISANTLSVYTADKKEGTGCLQSVGSGTGEFKKVFSPIYNSGATVATGKLQFWYYVSDITKFNADNQIELGSGGAADVNEYNWSIGTLVNGWNLITKTFSSAGTTGGTPDLNAINWIRIYHFKTASITTRIDAVQILNN